MGTTFNLNDYERKIIESLIDHPKGITTNVLLKELAKQHYSSKKTLLKYLDELESTGFIWREERKGRGWKRLIKLRPLITDIEKNARDFRKFCRQLLKLTSYKIKHDPKYDAIDDSLKRMNQRLIRELLNNMVFLKSAKVRKHLFQVYFESMEDFISSLARLLRKSNYKNKFIDWKRAK